jgi:mannose-6-phosphate isomerase-like protein (cupin superfamily)
MQGTAMISVTQPAEWLADIERFHGEWEGGDYGADICVIANHIDGPGRGPKLHKHPYTETFVIRSGRGLFTVGDRKIEARTGQILVVPANTPHKFENLGPGSSTRSTSTRTASSSPCGWNNDFRYRAG